MLPKGPVGVAGAPEDTGPFGSRAITAVTFPDVLRFVSPRSGGNAGKKPPPAKASPSMSAGSAAATAKNSAMRLVLDIVGLLSSGHGTVARFSRSLRSPGSPAGGAKLEPETRGTLPLLLPGGIRAGMGGSG